MSKSDKKQTPFSVTSFEIEDIFQNQQDETTTNQGERMELPLSRGSSVTEWTLPSMKVQNKETEKEDFKTKQARLEKEAYEKGFEQGENAGLALAKAMEKEKIEELVRENEKLTTEIKALLSEINNLKPKLYSESEEELLKLSIILAKTIIKTEVQTNQGIIGNSIRAALKFLADKRQIRIIINPGDMDNVKKILPEIAQITKGGRFQVTEDNNVSKGGCILETGFGKINASIEDQLEMLEEELTQLYDANQGVPNGNLP